MPNLRLGERGSLLGLFNDLPLRQAIRGTSQHEFSIRARPAKVLDVGASETIAAHESITGLSRPAALDRHCPDSMPQRQLTADHRRGSAAKTVRVKFFDLYGGASAIGFAGKRSKSGRQPVDGRAAEQIILRAQIEIPGNIGAPSPARALLCFG